MGKLDKIVDLYQQNGRGKLPVAIIQNGSLSNSKTVVGNIDSIINSVKNEKVGTPAIIVIGEVVLAQSEQLLEIVNTSSYGNK